MEGWIHTTSKEGRAQSSPPLAFMEQSGMGKHLPCQQNWGRAVSPSPVQGQVLVLRLPKKEKFSNRFSIPSPM